ncbi:hypothetical protein RDWZM_007129 [Blomia tropicalis]|uniref:T20D4.11-like domain-containing protein n=1 Tax=Blomia tropicalis TaxID=40697 RepID=A0A9Q0M933_BLOTA|nr:hypothetical protein BLOT_013698 [Blomia tropicalis]KAJ6221317.1 hypothetical protein RDWZM_007129 [Blomia tropicalis]
MSHIWKLFSHFVILYILLIIYLTVCYSHTATSIGKNPSVLIEGCLDDGCLTILTKNFHTISPCFDSLRETIPPEDEEYSLKLCCNVQTYERCIFPYIISYCGMDSLDKFEHELRSLNTLCSLSTLQWAKCEKNKTVEAEGDLELRE